jgi:mucin-19
MRSLVWKDRKSFFILLTVTIIAIQNLAPFVPPAKALTDTYSPTQATTWTVPSGVTSITVTAYGGSGGEGAKDGAGNIARSPGERGKVVATYSVTAGQVIGIYPGKKGGNGATSTNAGGGLAGEDTDPNANFNGGNGGAAGPVGSSGGGGGGGAASTLYIGGVLRLVAGGAGGGGGAANVAASGVNGYNTVSQITNQTNGGNGTQTNSNAANCLRSDGGGGGGGGGGRWGSAGGGLYQTGSECAGFGGYRGNNYIVEPASSISNTTDTSLTSDGAIEISYIGGQTITLSSLGTSSKSYPYSQLLSMSTTGSSGSGAITYALAASGSTASGCALSSSAANATLTATTSGTCLITATIAADSNYYSATSTAATFTFSKASQTLSFATSSYSKAFGETQTVTATSAGTGAITYSSGASTACTVFGNTVTVTASTGTCTVTASRAADDNYAAANSTNSVSITVSKAVQAALTLTSTSAVFLTNLRLLTSGGSGSGAVSYTVSSAGTAGCAVSNGDSLTATTAGTCVVVATKATSTDFFAAYDTRTVTVGKAPLTLTTSVAATLKYGSSSTATYSANRSLGVGAVPNLSGTLVFETSTTTACSINPASGAVTMNRASGTCNIRVSLTNDTNFLDTSSALVSITPATADALILTADSKTRVFTGSPVVVDPTYSISGLIGSDTVTVTYVYAGVDNAGLGFSLNATARTNAGSYSIVPSLSMANADSYTAPAIIVNGTLTIDRAARTLSPSSYSKTDLKYGESATVLSNVSSPSSNLDGSFIYTVGSGCEINSSTGAITATSSSGTCSQTTTISRGANYETATAESLTFNLSKADTLTVTTATPAALTYTGSPAVVSPAISVSGLVANESASGATFTFSRTPTCAQGGVCQVGDTGPGGGKVFYISGSAINAVSGISAGGIYLEMAPATFSKDLHKWCLGPANPNTTLFGAVATAIGTGASNTKIMIDNCSGGAGFEAANLTLGGKSDWFLPSFSEFVEIYGQREMLGLGSGQAAAGYVYWSSTEYDYMITASLVPWAGVGGQNKDQATPYLPIRAFSSTVSAYSSSTAPTNAGSYVITPSSLTLANSASIDNYVAVTYQTATLTINKASQLPFTNYSTLSGIFGSNFIVYKFGGSGDGEETFTVTNGTATGCALNGTVLTVTTAGSCLITATKLTSENYLQAESTFTVIIYVFVAAPTAPVSTTPTQIAIAPSNAWSTSATAKPKISGISPSTGPVGTVVTITGTDLNGVDTVRIGLKNLTSIVGISPTSVTGVIPAGASSGPIFVSNSLGGGVLFSGFTVTTSP